MSISGTRKSFIQQICANSGLKGKELRELRRRLAGMTDAQLQAELTKQLTGSGVKDLGVGVTVEHSDNVQTDVDYAENTVTYTDENGNEITDETDGGVLISRLIKTTDEEGNVSETKILYEDGHPVEVVKSFNGNEVESSKYTYFEDETAGNYVIIETEKQDRSKVTIKAAVVGENGEISQEDIYTRKTIAIDGTVSEEILKEVPVSAGDEVIEAPEADVKPEITTLERDGKTYTYTKYSAAEDQDAYVEIRVDNDVYKVKEVNEDGNFKDSDFISLETLDSQGRKVSIQRFEYNDSNGNPQSLMSETTQMEDGATLTKLYATPSFYMYEFISKMPNQESMQIYTKNGKDYSVSYTQDGNTVTHAAAGDGVYRLVQRLKFENTEQFYELNPNLRNRTIKAGENIVIPGHRNVTDSEILRQGTVYDAVVKNHNIYSALSMRTENFSNISEENFRILQNISGWELTNENVWLYNKLNEVEDASVQTNIVNYIKDNATKGKTPDQIKEEIYAKGKSQNEKYYFAIHNESTDTYIPVNLFDGYTMECRDLAIPIPIFIRDYMGLDYTKGEGKSIYERLSNITSSAKYMDVSQMFGDIAYRTNNAEYCTWYDEQKRHLDNIPSDKSILTQGERDYIKKYPPLSPEKAQEMYNAVLDSYSAPEGTVVKTKYDNYINDQKDVFWREYAASMMLLLKSQTGAEFKNVSDNKSMLSPGKYLSKFLSNISLTPNARKNIEEAIFCGNDKMDSVMRCYTYENGATTGFDVEKIKKCYEICNDSDSTDAMRQKAMEDAFGKALVDGNKDLISVINFFDEGVSMAIMLWGTGIIGKAVGKGFGLLTKVGAGTRALRAIEGVSTGAKLLESGVAVANSATTFGIWEGLNYTADYFTADALYTDENGEKINYWTGLGKAAGGGAAFGAFTGIWGQLVTQNALKIFKSPSQAAVSQKAMRAVSRQLEGSAKFTSKELMSAYSAAQAKAVSSMGKEALSFASEVVGFSTWEVAQTLLSREEMLNNALKGAGYTEDEISAFLEDDEKLKNALKEKGYSETDISRLTDIDILQVLGGQVKTLLSFKAVGQILFMHRQGKLPAGAIDFGKEKPLDIEAVKTGSKTEYKITYPDGKVRRASSMEEAVAISNEHYNDVTLYKPLEIVLERDKQMDLGDGLKIVKDESGYTIDFGGGRKVSSNNLKGLMAAAQNEYQIITYEKELDRKGTITLPNEQVITYDSEAKLYKTTIKSGTEVEGRTLKEALQKAANKELFENIETALEENNGQVKLNDGCVFIKTDEGIYIMAVADEYGVKQVIGKSVEEIFEKMNPPKVSTVDAHVTPAAPSGETEVSKEVEAPEHERAPASQTTEPVAAEPVSEHVPVKTKAELKAKLLAEGTYSEKDIDNFMYNVDEDCLDFVEKLCDSKQFSAPDVLEILGYVHSHNVKFAEMLCFGTKDIEPDDIEELLLYTTPENNNFAQRLVTDSSFDARTMLEILRHVAGRPTDFVEKICFDKDFPHKEHIAEILSVVKLGVGDFAYKLCCDEGYDYSSLIHILKQTNSNNISLAEKLCADKDFPKDNIVGILYYTNSENLSLAEKLCADKDFPKDKIAGILNRTNRANIGLAEKLCSEKYFDADIIEFIVGATIADNVSLAEKLCADKDFNEIDIINIVQSTNRNNISLAEKLCYSKDFPREYISEILKYTRVENLSLSERLCFDKDIPKDVIADILSYTVAPAGNDAEKIQRTEKVEKIIDTPDLRGWMLQNLKNGLDMGAIVELTKTQNKLLDETKQADKQTKTQLADRTPKPASINADPNAIQIITDALVSVGVPEKMAQNAYAKLCVDSNGNVDRIKLEAVQSLILAFGVETTEKNGKTRVNVKISPKDIQTIFESATGHSLSSQNGVFRAEIIKDIITFRQSGIEDPILASNIAVIQNISAIEMKARFNSKTREDIAHRIDNLPETVKQTLRQKGIDTESIKQKVLSEPETIDGGQVITVPEQTVVLRSLDNIVGVERLVLNRFKNEVSTETWQNEEAFKKWAQEKLESLYDWEQNPDFEATGQYSVYNDARKRGIEEWKKYLEEESTYKDDVFAKILFMDGMTKEMKPNNAATPPAVSHQTFEAVYNRIIEGNSSVSVSKMYSQINRERAMTKYGAETVETADGIKGRWITIPRSKKGDPDYDDNIAMVQALSEGSSWCLRFENAHNYLQGGNLHFFVDESGLSQVAINETDGQITQIQKRYEQDSTVPVPYVDVIEDWKTSRGYTGLEYSISEAKASKPEFDRLKSELTHLQAEGNSLEILKRLGYTVEIAPDGTYIIDSYDPFVKGTKFNMHDLGIDENKLFENISVIKGGLKTAGSLLTSAPKLREIGGGIDFTESRISDFRSLEKIKGVNVYWIKSQNSVKNLTDLFNAKGLKDASDAEIEQFVPFYESHPEFVEKALDRIQGVDMTAMSVIAECYEKSPEITEALLEGKITNGSSRDWFRVWDIQDVVNSNVNPELVKMIVKHRYSEDNFIYGSSEILNISKSYEKNPELVAKLLEYEPTPAVVKRVVNLYETRAQEIDNMLGVKNSNGTSKYSPSAILFVIDANERPELKNALERVKSEDFGGIISSMKATSDGNIVVSISLADGKTSEIVLNADGRLNEYTSAPSRISSHMISESEKIVRDDGGNILYTERYKLSDDVAGKFDIIREYPDGISEKVGIAEHSVNGKLEIIEKNFRNDKTGISQNYVYMEDSETSAVTTVHRIINQKTGEVLYEDKTSFRKIDDNHFTSKEGEQTYDIQYFEDKVIVTRGDGEKVEIPIGEGEVLESGLTNLYKQFSGSLYFDIAKGGLKQIAMATFGNAGGGAIYKDGEIIINYRLAEEFSTLLHELGHYRDDMRAISENEEIQEIFQKELEEFKKNGSSMENASFSYLNSLDEFVAESNAIIYSNNHYDKMEMRSQYLMEYFPETFAKVAKMLRSDGGTIIPSAVEKGVAAPTFASRYAGINGVESSEPPRSIDNIDSKKIIDEYVQRVYPEGDVPADLSKAREENPQALALVLSYKDADGSFRFESGWGHAFECAKENPELFKHFAEMTDETGKPKFEYSWDVVDAVKCNLVAPELFDKLLQYKRFDGEPRFNMYDISQIIEFCSDSPELLDNILEYKYENTDGDGILYRFNKWEDISTLVECGKGNPEFLKKLLSYTTRPDGSGEYRFREVNDIYKLMNLYNENPEGLETVLEEKSQWAGYVYSSFDMIEDEVKNSDANLLSVKNMKAEDGSSSRFGIYSKQIAEIRAKNPELVDRLLELKDSRGKYIIRYVDDLEAIYSAALKDEKLTSEILATGNFDADDIHELEDLYDHPDIIRQLLGSSIIDSYSSPARKIKEYAYIAINYPEIYRDYIYPSEDNSQFPPKYTNLHKAVECLDKNAELFKEISDIKKGDKPFADCDSICKIFDKAMENPELLQKLKSPEIIDRYKYASDMLSAFDLYKMEPQILEYVLTSKNSDGKFQFRELHNLEKFNKALEKNPEIVKRIIYDKNPDGTLRYSEIKDFESLTEGFLSTEALIKVLDMRNPDGSYRFDGKDMGTISSTAWFLGKEFILDMKYPDGSWMFSVDDISKISSDYSTTASLSREIWKNIDPLQEKYYTGELIALTYCIGAKNYEKYTPFIKEVLSDGKCSMVETIALLKSFNNLNEHEKTVDLMRAIINSKDSKTQSIKKLLTQSGAEVEMPYIDGTYQIKYKNDSNKTNIMTFKYDGDAGIEVVSVETVRNSERIKQETGSSGIQKLTVSESEIPAFERTRASREFSDGTRIVWEGDYKTSGENDRFNIAQRKTIYDNTGRQIRSEVITPVAGQQGQYTITTYDRLRDGGYEKHEVGTVRVFDQDGNSKAIERRVSSLDGTTTVQKIVSNDSGRIAAYTIFNPDGTVRVEYKRTYSKLDDTHARTSVNGDYYEIEYKDDRIVVSKLGADNKTPQQTIELFYDEGTEKEQFRDIDPELKDLCKTLPGDYFFEIYAKRTRIDAKDTSKKNAHFMYDEKTDETSIGMSGELKDNPFVYAHEQGHEIDFTFNLDAGTMKQICEDPELLKVYGEELAAYKSATTDTEGHVIDYFTTRIHKNEGGAITEAIAETHALLSGLYNESFDNVAMRSIVLQQYFPRTIAKIAEKFEQARKSVDADNRRVINPQQPQTSEPPKSDETPTFASRYANLTESEAEITHRSVEEIIKNENKSDASVEDMPAYEPKGEYRADGSEDPATHRNPVPVPVSPQPIYPYPRELKGNATYEEAKAFLGNAILSHNGKKRFTEAEIAELMKYYEVSPEFFNNIISAKTDRNTWQYQYLVMLSMLNQVKDNPEIVQRKLKEIWAEGHVTETMEQAAKQLSEMTVTNGTKRFTPVQIRYLAALYDENPELLDKMINAKNSKGGYKYDYRTICSNMEEVRKDSTYKDKLYKAMWLDGYVTDTMRELKTKIIELNTQGKINIPEAMIEEYASIGEVNPQLFTRLLLESKVQLSPYQMKSVLNKAKTETDEEFVMMLFSTHPYNSVYDLNPIFTGHNLEKFLGACAAHPEQAKELWAMTRTHIKLNGKAETYPMFDVLSVPEVLAYSEHYPNTIKKLISAVQKVNVDGNIVKTPLLTGYRIDKIMKNLYYNNEHKLTREKANFVEKLLEYNKYTTVSGQLEEWDIIDALVLYDSVPELAESALSKDRIKTVLSVSKIADTTGAKKLLENENVFQFVNEHMQSAGEKAKLKLKESPYVNGVHQLITSTKDSIDIVEFSVDENGKVIQESTEYYTPSSTRERSHKNYADGTTVVSEVDYGNTSIGRKAMKLRKTYYDVYGVQRRSEVFIPSTELEGQYKIMTYERGLDKSMAGHQVGIAETSPDGNRVVKTIESPDGTITSHTIETQGESRIMTYEIADAEGNILFSERRSSTFIDENHKRTFLDGQEYLIEYGEDSISVQKLDETGLVTDSVILDGSSLDISLMDLYRQMPGDYFFVLAQQGTSVGIDNKASNKNNAYFESSNNTIKMSDELKRSGFIAAHELGHGMDHKLLNELNQDSTLLAIFNEELENYKHNSTATEGYVIDYFTTRIHKNKGGCITEVIAETNALLSGLYNDDPAIYMRGVILEQNFPRTVAYIGQKMKDATLSISSETRVDTRESENRTSEPPKSDETPTFASRYAGVHGSDPGPEPMARFEGNTNQKANAFIDVLWDRLVSEGKIKQRHIDFVNNECETPQQKLAYKLRYIKRDIEYDELAEMRLSAEERQIMVDFVKENSTSDFDPSVSDADLLDDFINVKEMVEENRMARYFDYIAAPVNDFAGSIALEEIVGAKTFAAQFTDMPPKLYDDIGHMIGSYISDYYRNYGIENGDKRRAYIEKLLKFDYSKASQRLAQLKEVFGDRLSQTKAGEFFFEEDAVFDAKLDEYKNRKISSESVSYTDENGNTQQRSLKGIRWYVETDENMENIKELAKLTYIDSEGKTVFRFEDHDLSRFAKYDITTVKELAQIMYEDIHGNIKPRFKLYEIEGLINAGYNVEQIKKLCECTVEKVKITDGDNVSYKMEPLYVYRMREVLDSGIDIDFVVDVMQSPLKIFGKDANMEQKIDYILDIYKKYPDKMDAVKVAMLEFGIKYKNLDKAMKEYGDQLIQLSQNIKKAREQYGIEDSPLEIAQEDDALALVFTSRRYGDDTYIRITDKNGNVFKFDRTTLDLVTVSTPDRTINVRDGVVTKVDVDFEFKYGNLEDITKELGEADPAEKQMLERKAAAPTRVEIYVNKATGEEISHQEMLESSDIKGEYEIYSYDTNGNRFLVGLAEMDGNGGKHVEKNLISLDGTKTDTVFALDKDGRTFMYYKITSPDGNVLYEATKKRYVIDDNHYRTTEKINGVEQSCDIQITADKVIITKLDAQGNPTSEVVEFNICDFSEDLYKQVNDKVSFMYNPDDDFGKIEEIMHNAGVQDYTIDRKLLPMLKKLSGAQWLRLKENGTKYLVEGFNMKNNAASFKGFIMVSPEMSDYLPVFLHEAGHERFSALDLVYDEELRQIYEEEKALYTATFPDDMIGPIEYFLFANDIKTARNTAQEGRGINEGVAETNALTETPQEWDIIQGRTALWQQFFPRTIAKIAEKTAQARSDIQTSDADTESVRTSGGVNYIYEPSATRFETDALNLCRDTYGNINQAARDLMDAIGRYDKKYQGFNYPDAAKMRDFEEIIEGCKRNGVVDESLLRAAKDLYEAGMQKDSKYLREGLALDIQMLFDYFNFYPESLKNDVIKAAKELYEKENVRNSVVSEILQNLVEQNSDGKSFNKRAFEKVKELFDQVDQSPRYRYMRDREYGYSVRVSQIVRSSINGHIENGKYVCYFNDIDFELAKLYSNSSSSIVDVDFSGFRDQETGQLDYTKLPKTLVENMKANLYNRLKSKADGQYDRAIDWIVEECGSRYTSNPDPKDMDFRKLFAAVYLLENTDIPKKEVSLYLRPMFEHYRTDFKFLEDYVKAYPKVKALGLYDEHEIYEIVSNLNGLDIDRVLPMLKYKDVLKESWSVETLLDLVSYIDKNPYCINDQPYWMLDKLNNLILPTKGVAQMYSSIGIDLEKVVKDLYRENSYIPPEVKLPTDKKAFLHNIMSNKAGEGAASMHDVAQIISSIEKGIPEFADVTNKEQIAQLLIEAVNSPEYENLDDQSKTMLKYSIILSELKSDIRKAILKSYNVSDRLCKRIENIINPFYGAAYIQNQNDFEILKIYETSLNKVDPTKSLRDFDKLQKQIEFARETTNVIYPSQLVNLGLVPLRTVKVGDLTISARILDLTSSSTPEDLSKVGFEPGTTKDNLRLLCHMFNTDTGSETSKIVNIMRALNDPESNGITLSASMFDVNIRDAFGSGIGVVVAGNEVSSIPAALDMTFHSNLHKDDRTYQSWLFNQPVTYDPEKANNTASWNESQIHSKARIFARDNLMEAFKNAGFELTQAEYGQLVADLQNHRFINSIKDVTINGRIIPAEVVQNAIVTAQNKIIEKGGLTEILVNNPTIQAIITKGSIERIPKSMLLYASQYNIPIIKI